VAKSIVRMNPSTFVAIVGAGPYGLSLAAHLEKKRIPFRIFGPPMQVWQSQMPAGMHLKSDGFASDLYDPDRSFTLKQYCADRTLSYADYGLPVRLDTFTAYALEFQKRFVPTLEPKLVADVRREAQLYRLRLDDGETLTADTVVIATGISFFGYVPDSLASLPIEKCTHSSAHHDLSAFRNQRVLVAGGGASATDLAALLLHAGAAVTLVSRSTVKFHLPPSDLPPSLFSRIRRPNLGLGPGLRSAVYTKVPGLFRFLPQRLRRQIVRRHLGPAGGWFIKDQVVGKAQVLERHTIRSANLRGNIAAIEVVNQQGDSLEIEADHVIAATGYRVSLDSLSLLDRQLRATLKSEENSPKLSSNFESSSPGLYFIGIASASQFGPLMRFARGAEYAARRLSTHLARNPQKIAESDQAAAD
jgi:thioredoxin reductase